jgi:leucyl aminopeptidase
LDRLWPFPLYPEYSQELKSEIADLANIGPRMGGAITAAAFLSHFVPEKKKWAHLDIAPTFMLKKNRGLHRKGATGFGVRVLYYYAKTLSENK